MELRGVPADPVLGVVRGGDRTGAAIVEATTLHIQGKLVPAIVGGGRLTPLRTLIVRSISVSFSSTAEHHVLGHHWCPFFRATIGAVPLVLGEHSHTVTHLCGRPTFVRSACTTAWGITRLSVRINRQSTKRLRGVIWGSRDVRTGPKGIRAGR